MLAYSSVKEMHQITILNEKYTATVISYTSETEDDSNGNFYVIYKPLVQFKTNTGNIIEKELDFQKSRIKIGIPIRFIMMLKTMRNLNFQPN